MEKTKIFF